MSNNAAVSIESRETALTRKLNAAINLLSTLDKHLTKVNPNRLTAPPAGNYRKFEDFPLDFRASYVCAFALDGVADLEGVRTAHEASATAMKIAGDWGKVEQLCNNLEEVLSSLDLSSVTNLARAVLSEARKTTKGN